ncbi:PAAR-like domain-containing protein [Hyalangium sp.]|uniref:PAAR-like domain-containing protein n=1 Tax=Hyalangium sp. TaxID=2028555 RepID=UPI002D68BA9C|nr:PAAR-like domain-containing protein [Hyalangium sp.]HYI02170.1 PAAR-like domain-containing protein [Hyalangium sp.]
MSTTVIVNNLTVVHKDTGGMAIAFPDVCKTPTPAGPVPIPYPNTAMSSNTAEGSQTVKADGQPMMLKSSYFSMSAGDEAGSAMGVASNKIKGKAYPKMYSFDVKVEGQNVFRFSDIMLQNGGSPTNTAPATELQMTQVAMGGSAAGKQQKAKEPELTRLKWSRKEACCGDKVQLSIRSKNVDGELPLPVTVHRSEDRKAVLATLLTTLKGNKAEHDWITVRGPYKKTVMARGLQKELKGKEMTSPNLELKSPAPTQERILGNRTAPKYVIMNVAGVDQWVPAGTNYGWQYGFDIAIKDGELVVTRPVQFRLEAGVVLGPKRKRAWKRQIEAIWNRKFKLHRTKCKRGGRCDCSSRNGCCSFTIRIVCQFGPWPQNPVDLHKGANDGVDPATGSVPTNGRWWYSNTWWEGLQDVPATVRAHEFGHLIGMYDEYPGGAVEASLRFWSVPASIMNAGSKVYKRHMKDFHDWFTQKTQGLIGPTALVPLRGP